MQQGISCSKIQMPQPTAAYPEQNRKAQARRTEIAAKAHTAQVTAQLPVPITFRKYRINSGKRAFEAWMALTGDIPSSIVVECARVKSAFNGADVAFHIGIKASRLYASQYTKMEGLFLLKNIDLFAFTLSLQYPGIHQHYFHIEAKYRSNRRSWTKEAHSTLVHKLKDAKWVPQKQKDNDDKYTFLKPCERGYRIAARWICVQDGDGMVRSC